MAESYWRGAERRKEELDGGADDELEDSPPGTQEDHVEGEEAGREEQQVGLDGVTEAEEKTAEAPVVVEEHVEGGMETEHGHGVVEEMEDGDGLYTVLYCAVLQGGLGEERRRRLSPDTGRGA